MFNKRILLSVLLIFCVVAFIGAQQSRNETTAEEDYLSTFEDMIINELSISDEYDNKIVRVRLGGFNHDKSALRVEALV